MLIKTVISPSTLYFPIFVPQGQSLWIILAISLSYPFIKKKKVRYYLLTFSYGRWKFILSFPSHSLPLKYTLPLQQWSQWSYITFQYVYSHIYYCDCANTTHNWAMQLILITFSLLYDFLILNAVNIEKKKEKKMVAEKKSSSGVRKYSQI